MNREQYLLVKLAEEGLETAQRATKAATFGLYQVQEGQLLNNLDRLFYEYNDMVAIMRMLGVPTEPDETAINKKVEKLKSFMALSVALGKLDPQDDLVGVVLPERI